MKFPLPIQKTLIGLLACFGISTLISSNTLAQDMPKIGLVLSGGGAKGMAHIGFLKELEAAGIVPDYVTGTSMGAIVGGLYATGYSPSELEEIALTADWDVLLSNQISFEQVAIEEKDYYGRYVLDLPIRDLTPSLPSGLIEGQNLSEFISRLTRSVHQINNFDSLPIPFRCVATDISSGEAVIIGKGSLPTAMRASMAIPSIFTTVSMDGRLLVDGGLVRNFPVQEVIDMGADIVIGVFVSSDLKAPEKLESLVDILSQSAFIMSALDSREQAKLCDYYIEPNLEGYGTYSFTSAKEIITLGEDAGQGFKKTLDSLSNSLNSLGYKYQRPKRIEENTRYLLSKVSVIGNDEIPSRLIKAKLRVHELDTLDVDVLGKRINEVYGTGYFQRITYDLTPEKEGYHLRVKVRETEKARLKMALHYNNEIRAGINANLTLRNILLKSSRFIAEVDIAENPRIDINYLKYLGVEQNLAITVGMDLLFNEIPLFSDGQQLSTFSNELWSPYVQIQTTFRPTRSLGIRAGSFYNRLSPKVSSALGLIDRINVESHYAEAFVTFNNLDKPFFPNSGHLLNLSYRYAFSNSSGVRLTTDTVDSQAVAETFAVDPFQSASLEYLGYYPLTDWLNIQLGATVKYVNETDIGVNNQTGIGGFFYNYPTTQVFWGARLYEYITPYYGLLRAGLRVEPVSKVYIQGWVNYLDSEYPAQWIDPNNPDVDFDDGTSLLGWGFGASYNSPFGPLSVTIGKTDNSDSWRTGINLGFWIK